VFWKRQQKLTSIFIVGDCPVGCGGDDIRALKDKHTHTPVYYCSACGCAYKTLSKKLDEINGLQDLAQNGLTPMTEAEILQQSLTIHAVEEVEFEKFIALALAS